MAREKIRGSFEEAFMARLFIVSFGWKQEKNPWAKLVINEIGGGGTQWRNNILGLIDSLSASGIKNPHFSVISREKSRRPGPHHKISTYQLAWP